MRLHVQFRLIRFDYSSQVLAVNAPVAMFYLFCVATAWIESGVPGSPRAAPASTAPAVSSEPAKIC